MGAWVLISASWYEKCRKQRLQPKLDYINSAGLCVLLVAAKKLEGVDGELRFCNLNEIVREVFDISGFTTIFRVFGSEAEALDGF